MGVSIREKVWLENSLSQLEGGLRRRGGPVTEQVVTFHNLPCKMTHLYPVTVLLIDLSYFQAKPFLISIPQLFSNLVIIHLLAYEDGTDRVFRNVSI